MITNSESSDDRHHFTHCLSGIFGLQNRFNRVIVQVPYKEPLSNSNAVKPWLAARVKRETNAEYYPHINSVKQAGWFLPFL
jgi:hypothetical protein